MGVRGPVVVQIRCYFNRRLEIAGSRASSRQIEGVCCITQAGARVLLEPGESCGWSGYHEW